MDFVGNSLLFTAVKNFANRSRIDKVIAMDRVAPFFLTHSVVKTLAFGAFAFSALTLLVGRQKAQPVCKQLCVEVLAWLSIWSQVQMICI